MNLKIVKSVLEESDRLARENHNILLEKGVFAINLMSAPGSGKTTILKKTIPRLQALNIRSAVIEGDITSTLDSEQFQPLGIQVIQVNTEPFGGDCHIGSHFIRSALDMLDLDTVDVLFIENVGNLVCPAEFDIGEDRKVVVLSLPEGRDKPLKYPLMFRVCNLCLLNKIDLASVLEESIQSYHDNIRTINGGLAVLPVSGKTEEGLKEWIKWITNQRRRECRSKV